LRAQASAFARLLSTTDDPEIAFRQATALGEGLFPHQVEGMAFLLGRRRAILADDMGLGKTRQVDDPLRLAAYERLAQSPSLDDLTDMGQRLITGFHFAVIPSRIAPASLPEFAELLHAHPAIVQELRELIPLLDERADHLTYPLELTQADGSPLVYLCRFMHGTPWTTS
jgi:hypothetical protein